jgi:hypothetical protein
MEVHGRLHAPVALPPGKMISALDEEKAGQAPPGRWEIKKNLLPLPGTEPWPTTRTYNYRLVGNPEGGYNLDYI